MALNISILPAELPRVTIIPVQGGFILTACNAESGCIESTRLATNMNSYDNSSVHKQLEDIYRESTKQSEVDLNAKLAAALATATSPASDDSDLLV